MPKKISQLSTHTPIDADYFPLVDSVAVETKRTLWSVIKSTLKTYFDTLYIAGLASAVDSEVVLFSGTGGKTVQRASASGIAKLTSGVLSAVTAPSGTIVGTSDTQTLTNKTSIPKVTAVSDGAGAVIDAATGNTFTWSAAADRTAGTTTNPTTGQRIIIAFTASGGARTLTLPTATTGDFLYGSDITVLTQTVSGKTDYIGCIYNGTRWAVVAYVKGY